MESCSFITSLSKSMTFLFWFWYRSLDGYMTDWFVGLFPTSLSLCHGIVGSVPMAEMEVYGKL